MQSLRACFFLGTLLATHSLAAEIECPSLISLPEDMLSHITSFADQKSKACLRETCQTTKGIVEKNFETVLDQQFNKFITNVSDRHQSLYKKKRLTDRAHAALEKDGYFFFTKKNDMESLLPQGYHTLSLYDLLAANHDWAADLFRELFQKDLPTQGVERALNHLAACLPMSHWYVKQKNPDAPSLIETFKKEHHASLLKVLRQLREQNNYFLVGIDSVRNRQNNLADSGNLIWPFTAGVRRAVIFNPKISKKVLLKMLNDEIEEISELAMIKITFRHLVTAHGEPLANKAFEHVAVTVKRVFQNDH